MRQIKNQAGFGSVLALVVVVIVAVIGVGGWLVYKHHANKLTVNNNQTITQTNSQQTMSNNNQSAQTATQYLDIKEWHVKLPLSGPISDAYYVVPSGISPDEDGLPSGIDLGVKSLNNSCGTVTSDSAGYKNSLGSIIRALPTDTDPVSGKPYTQLDPNGVTIGGYYYGYANAIFETKTCSSKPLLQSVDTAFANATKNAVAD